MSIANSLVSGGNLRGLWKSACDAADGGSKLEPVAAIGNPPTHNANGNGCRHCPPKWQDEISQQAQAGESDPKDLSLHSLILARMYREEAALPGKKLALTKSFASPLI